MPRRSAIVLAVLLASAAALRTGYFTGLQIGDDIVYSRIAVDRLNGKVDVSNTQETRTGFLLPILASYALFGPGEHSLVLYNVLCSVGLVAGVFFLARRLFGDDAAPLAALAAAVHPNLVRFASECHTDTPLALWITLALLAFHSALDADPGARRRLLCGVLLGWAYLHKESVVYMAPFFAGHFWITRRRWTWYLPVALPVVGVAVAEMIGYAALTGNPVERYTMVRTWHAGYMAERYRTLGSILHRQFVELPVLMFTPWYGRTYTGLVNLTCLAAGGVALWRSAPRPWFAWGWFATLFACYCLWPSSLSPFLPGFFLFEWTLPVLAAPLAVLLASVRPVVPKAAAVAVAAVVGLASLGTIHGTREDGRSLSAGSREAAAWLKTQPVARVVTDDKTIEGIDFFEGHRPSRVYIPFQDAQDLRGTVVLVDKFWSQPGQWWSRPVPEVALHPPPTWTKLHETGRLIVYRP